MHHRRRAGTLVVDVVYDSHLKGLAVSSLRVPSSFGAGWPDSVVARLRPAKQWIWSRSPESKLVHQISNAQLLRESFEYLPR